MIFISYSWNDKEIVKPIYELTKNYFGEDKVFIDFEKNTQGSNYWKNINNAIKSSQYFLFFNSINYNNSSACAKEFLFALKLEKITPDNFKILEIKLDNIESHPSLIQKIYKKFTNNNDVFNSIVDAITKSDFKSFEKNKLSKLISQNILDENSFEVKFSVSRKVSNPKFVLLSEKKSNINFDILTKHNMNIGSLINEPTGEIPMKINETNLIWNFFIKDYISSELFPQLEYKIQISNFDNSKICVLIFDEFLGGDHIDVNNYDPIFLINF